ncbi:hypothetical protein PSEUDO8Z_60441 [Pseudomonas sp. 8Z]|nr:hypothetical protein PSEUDO8Z_60441 [Pseudomonas sp. 8Z]
MFYTLSSLHALVRQRAADTTCVPTASTRPCALHARDKIGDRQKLFNACKKPTQSSYISRYSADRQMRWHRKNAQNRQAFDIATPAKSPAMKEQRT